MREIKLPKIDCMLTDSVGTTSVPKSATKVSLGVQESICISAQRFSFPRSSRMGYIRNDQGMGQKLLMEGLAGARLH